MSNILLTRDEYISYTKKADDYYLISDEHNLYLGETLIKKEFSAPLIPSGYTPCDYVWLKKIDSSWGYCLDIASGANFKLQEQGIFEAEIKLDLNKTAQSRTINLGYCGEGDIVTLINQYSNSEANNTRFVMGRTSYAAAPTIIYDPTTWYKFKVELINKNIKMYINDSLVWTNTSTDILSSILTSNIKPIYFSQLESNDAIYSKSITYTSLDGDKIFELLPCYQDSTDIGGFYDTVSNAFYTNHPNYKQLLHS